MRFKRALIRIIHRLFGKIISDRRYRLRERINKSQFQEPSKLVEAFRRFEVSLQPIKYPNNEFNQIMSMVLSDIELFEHITARFRSERKLLGQISAEDRFLHRLDPKRRSYPMHPLERANSRSLKIDTQSLFIFGMIMVNRMSLLLRLYLPDRSTVQKKEMYSKIGILYTELNRAESLSKTAQKFKDEFAYRIKWIYAVLRFYRNEFIEHLDKGYQLGMNYGTYTSDFALSADKWDYGDEDDTRVESFRSKLEEQEIKIPGRSGHRSLVNRYYVQQVFDHIALVPEGLLNEALNLIEDIGANSPQPEKVIRELEEYVEDVLNFMTDELESSELAKHKAAFEKVH